MNRHFAARASGRVCSRDLSVGRPVRDQIDASWASLKAALWADAGSSWRKKGPELSRRHGRRKIGPSLPSKDRHSSIAVVI